MSDPFTDGGTPVYGTIHGLPSLYTLPSLLENQKYSPFSEKKRINGKKHRDGRDNRDGTAPIVLHTGVSPHRRTRP